MMPDSDQVAAQRKLRVDALRVLAMDAVQAANSGHPGMPMGMADIAEVLWKELLKHNPADPGWIDRDRFVLSNGHGSMLLYALLHLTGYELSMDDIRRFRQLGSKTPGHPEYGVTAGVETTTGPLGQGFANAVGMAMAEKTLAAQFNRPGHQIIDHKTYAFVGDGCLMEGVSHEAASLAGTHKLGKLITIYDDNGISIDGAVDEWFTDDTPARFRAYGWHVIEQVDGHDHNAVRQAVTQAIRAKEQPSLICCKTVLGFGSPGKQGTAAAHGAPLGDEQVRLAREAFDWELDPFEIPASVYETFNCEASGKDLQQRWRERFNQYASEYPELASELERRAAKDLPESWERVADAWIRASNQDSMPVASRKSSLLTLNSVGPALPELIGGSADLTGSNLTFWQDSVPITPQRPDGNYIYFGVREFAMSCIINGLALHGGFIPYCATFLTFSEYARNALRMAALMEIRAIFIYTHDSIGLGEDGPTHQAVEQAATLRLMPNMSLWRPCDTAETAVAWRAALERRNGPTCLLFSRQSLPQQSRSADQCAQIKRGGYVLLDTVGDPDAIIIATGSEVQLATEAAALLNGRGCSVRVVSLPSVDVFEAQDEQYRESVLPSKIRKRVVVEAGVTPLWLKYATSEGVVLGIDQFGRSAPASDVYDYFNLTPQAVENAVAQLLDS